MCGVSALFSFKGLPPESEAIIKNMNRAQSHRGPDDEGYHCDNNVALGHRRLSIIDLEGGHQPIYNEDESVVVVFNGEIFNYRSIAEELKAAGHVFKTNSDTETIVHAWEEWGVNCLDHFRGMFVFILWDSEKGKLFVARDRLGVKPLFYTTLPGGEIGFGSELKVLRSHPSFNRELSKEAIEEYLAFGYVPDPRSIYQDTYKLEAGHYVLFDVTTPQAPAPVKYWDLPDLVEDNRLQNKSAEQYKKEFEQEFAEAVKIRMEADVPLGAFLSGGVDSSAVVAFMSQQSDKPVSTCAIGFDVPDFDETAFAKLVADRYRTNHTVDIVDHRGFDMVDTLLDVYDEPYSDSSAIPTFKVCQLARKQVTVALSGDGGDELFAGYRRYKLHMAEEAVRKKVPQLIRQLIFKPLGKIYPKLDWAPQFFRAKTTFQSLAMSTSEAFMNSMSKLRKDERSSLYSKAFKNSLGGYSADEVYKRYLNGRHFADPLKLIQFLDYKTWIVGDANTKVDRVSMANGLEVRSPFMDHKLVEWAWQIPSHFNLKKGETKAILKEALEPHLPHENLYRKKMGFSVPMAEWLRGPLKEKMYSALQSDALVSAKIFDRDELDKKMEEHCSGQSDHSAALWTIMMLGLFLQKELSE